MSLVIRTAPEAKVLTDATSNDFGSVDAVGRILFTQGLVPFELSSALLMVAVVGAVPVARGRHASDGHHAEGAAKELEAPQAAARAQGASR
jgi:NADH-quinone oxidoreductase subunit J